MIKFLWVADKAQKKCFGKVDLNYHGCFLQTMNLEIKECLTVSRMENKKLKEKIIQFLWHFLKRKILP